MFHTSKIPLQWEKVAGAKVSIKSIVIERRIAKGKVKRPKRRWSLQWLLGELHLIPVD